MVKVVGLEKLGFVGIYTSNADGARLAFYDVAYLSEFVETELFEEDDTQVMSIWCDTSMCFIERN